MVVLLALFFPLLLAMFSLLFIQFRCVVTNYLGKKIPYSLGFGVLISILMIYNIMEIKISIIFIYLIVLWLTGFIDDYFGAKFPKGLKGHIFFFFKTGKVSTGLLKLGSTSVMAMIVALTHKVNFISGLAIFFLLTITPHVMNLFDTRPLRVWKVIIIHCPVFIPSLLHVQMHIQLLAFWMIGILIYFERSTKAMLGDNGATLLGGIVAVIAVQQLSLTGYWLLIGIYFFVIFVTERISITKWIEARPILRKIDRWGVS